MRVGQDEDEGNEEGDQQDVEKEVGVVEQPPKPLQLLLQQCQHHGVLQEAGIIAQHLLLRQWTLSYNELVIISYHFVEGMMNLFKCIIVFMAKIRDRIIFITCHFISVVDVVII